MTTASDILKRIKDEDIKYVDLRFTDMRGKLQHVTFDVTMIEVGQYHSAWPDWHIGPEQAVTAHRMLKGRTLLPVHWGLFSLAAHGWTEPIERVLAAAAQTGEAVTVPKPGQSIEPSAPPALERWWPALPWNTAAQDPIISSQVN